MTATSISRTPIARAELFLRLAAECDSDHRAEFEAFVEATIVFLRAAFHRLQTQHRRHPNWSSWWSAIATNPSVAFIRKERDWLLKEAPPKLGQKVFVPCIGINGSSPGPVRAEEFYYFDVPDVPATATLLNHLEEVRRLHAEATALFSK